MLRMLTAGESHGQAVVVIVDGLPSGLRLEPADLDRDLARRQLGYGRGGRMSIERDRAEVIAGVRFGVTLGSPVAVMVPNRDRANWSEAMSVWGEPPSGYAPVTCPRPGHADLAGALKYGHGDLRAVLERASARETAGRVVAGALAKAVLREAGACVGSQVLGIGDAAAEDARWPARGDRDACDAHGDARGDARHDSAAAGASWAAWQAAVDASPVRCGCPVGSEAMTGAIDRAAAGGYSLGGLFEVRAGGLPPGLGSYAQWDRRLDTRLAAALMSIQGIKGVEIGAGFALAGLTGDRAHDEIEHDGRRFRRPTNRAGGLEGGVTNGEPLIVRCAMKPIATQARPLCSVDLVTKQPALAHRERADVCAVPAAAVVAEAVVAFTLADALLEKCGGDSAAEMRRNLDGYLAEVRAR